MCRSRDFERGGRRIQGRRSLKIESVGFILSGETSGGMEDVECVSLVLMPRIDGSPLVVNGSKIASDIPTFITLHRVTSTSVSDGEAVFRSKRDVVEGWCDGLSFEVHLGQHCLVRGVFRHCKTNVKGDGDWKMECKWVGKPEIRGLLGINEAVMSVDLDRDECGILRERMVVDDIRIDSDCRRKRRWRSKRCGSFKMCLPDIPEVDEDEDDDEQEDWYCKCGCEDEDMKMEDYTWAVDVSFWAVCVGLGLGFMVSHTSKKTLCLSKFLPL